MYGHQAGRYTVRDAGNDQPSIDGVQCARRRSGGGTDEGAKSDASCDPK